MRKLKFPKVMKFQCDSENRFDNYKVKKNWININSSHYEVNTRFYEVKTKIADHSSQYEIDFKTVIQV